MAAAYAWADAVVCRAGALTVAEISAAGLPAVFVPYPAAVDDHQTANARALTESGAALTVQERDIDEESLATILGEFLEGREALVARAERARAHATPDSLARIAECCLQASGGAA